MNKLSLAKRAKVLELLCEGMSMRSIERVVGCSINTVDKLLREAGVACAIYHDEHVHELKSKRVQVDEIWSFTYAKAKNVADAKAAPLDAGDTWTWTAIDADSKLIVSWFVGARDAECGSWFMKDVARRLANRVQLTSDGHRAYLQAVSAAFGGEIDYAMLTKIYGAPPASREASRRYSPAECVGTRTDAISGDPDPKHISTSYAERANLTMRMHMRRFTRLTNGFSKKLENHAHMVALYTLWYNFVRIHKTLRVSPAMAAGVTDRLWSMEEIAALCEPQAPPTRGTYKPRQPKLVAAISN